MVTIMILISGIFLTGLEGFVITVLGIISLSVTTTIIFFKMAKLQRRYNRAEGRCRKYSKRIGRINGAREEQIQYLGILEQKMSALRTLNAQVTDERDEVSRKYRALRGEQEAFFVQITHRMLTGLNSIIGVAEVLNKGVLNREESDLFLMLTESTHGLLQFIKNIVRLSEVEAGRVDLRIKAFHSTSILEGLKDFFSKEMAKKNIKLVQQIDKTVPEYIIGDLEKIKEVLYYLIFQAILFTEQGQVGIEIEVLEEIKMPFGEVIVDFKVIDNGVGLQREKIESLFNIHQNRELLYTQKYGESTLGFVIAKGLIELMNGYIDIDSHYGDGTKITFGLPLKILEKIEHHVDRKIYNKQQQQQLPDNINILLAEDNEINQLMIQKLFDQFIKNKGWGFDIACNGKEAVEQFEKRDYDLILMDVQMPMMNGIVATQMIRKKERKSGKHIPIVALTAFSMEMEQKRFIAAGMDDYIAKPINVKHFFETLGKYLNHLG